MMGMQAVKPGIVRAEVFREPLLQFGRQPGFIEFAVVFNTIHDVAKLVEQCLMILFVRRIAVIAGVAHELFFECEMRGNLREYLAERFNDLVMCRSLTH